MLKVMISCVKRTDSHKEEKVSPPLHNIYNIVTSLVATLYHVRRGCFLFKGQKLPQGLYTNKALTF